MPLRVLCVAVALWLAALTPALAQDISLQFGEDGSLALRGAQLVVLLTLLSLAPGILVMVTCFPFIVTVLAILRQALGLMQSPPNMLMVSLALFLTYFVMEPVFVMAWQNGIVPFNDGDIAMEEAFLRHCGPVSGLYGRAYRPGDIREPSQSAPNPGWRAWSR